MTRSSLLQRLLSSLKKHSSLIVIANFLVIIILTWMPFNFAVPLDLSWAATIDQFRGTPDTSNSTDVIVNVLFFIPLGIGGGAWLTEHWQRFRSIQVLAITLLVSFGLSLTVETGQLFLISREPGLIDLATNSFGGFLGVGFYLLVERFQKPLVYFFDRLTLFRQPQLLFRALITFWLAYLGLMSGLLISVADSNQLTNWRADLPLIVGNENTGDRPWTGTIHNLCISDQALETSYIRQAIGKHPCPKLEQTTEFSSSYAFAPLTQNYPDLADNSPSLQSLNITVSDKREGVTLGSHNMLRSTESPLVLNRRIRDSSQFTLITDIATDNFQQEGPARIISLSQDLHHRNLTLAQSRQDLSLRLRMPFTGDNGKQPEIRLNNFFRDTDFHPLAVVYDGLELHFISYGLDKTLYLGSEAALFWSTFGIISEKMFLIVNVDWFNKILYYSFIFVPLGISFGLICHLLKTNSIVSLGILLTSGLLVPPLLIEGIINSTSDRTLTWQYPVLGFIVLSVSFWLTKFARSRITS